MSCLTVHFHNYSRGHLRRVISAGGVQVDGHGGKPAYRVHAGQRVRIVLPEIPRQSPRPEAIPLEILFEDEDLVVVNKPPGMVVHPARGHWSGTLVSALAVPFRPQPQQQRRPACGRALFTASTATPAARSSSRGTTRRTGTGDPVPARTIEKEYFALVVGTPELDSDIINRSIAVHPVHREKMTTVRDAEDGRTAQTFYRVVERFRGFAAVRAMPKTGRTHQIRVHLAHIGLPGALRPGLRASRGVDPRRTQRRRRRHDGLAPSSGAAAARLRFKHPRDGRPMEIEAPLPADIAGVLTELRPMAVSFQLRRRPEQACAVPAMNWSACAIAGTALRFFRSTVLRKFKSPLPLGEG